MCHRNDRFLYTNHREGRWRLRQPIIVSLLCGVSTVDGDVLACDERRTGSTEPEHGAGNLLRGADAANRGLCRNRFLHLRLAFTEGAVKHFGLDRAGRDTVDTDALSGELQRSRPGEADNSELAGHVNRRTGKADVATDGRVIY